MSISFVQRTSHLSRFNYGFQQNSRASARVSLVRRFVPRALLLIARHLQIVNSFILSIHSVETSLLSQSYFLIYLFSFIYFPFIWTWGLDSCYWRKASLTPKTLHPLDQDALFRIRLWTLRFRWDLQVIPLLLWYVDTSTFFDIAPSLSFLCDVIFPMMASVRGWLRFFLNRHAVTQFLSSNDCVLFFVLDVFDSVKCPQHLSSLRFLLYFVVQCYSRAN